jgi:hypothetical protein
MFKLGTMRKGADGFVLENLWKIQYMIGKAILTDIWHDKEKDRDEKKTLNTGKEKQFL